MNRRFVAIIAALVLATGPAAHAEEAPVPENHQEGTQVQSAAPEAKNEVSAQSPAPAPAEPPVRSNEPGSSEKEPSLADLKREIARLQAAQRVQVKQLERQESQIHELTTELLNTARTLHKLAKSLDDKLEPTTRDENVPTAPAPGNKAARPMDLKCGEEKPAVMASPPPNV